MADAYLLVGIDTGKLPIKRGLSMTCSKRDLI